MKHEEFQNMRREYIHKPFEEKDAAQDPIQQFKSWLDLAVEKVLDMPNAMTLATVSSNGEPSARIVLLKHYDEQGFEFYTNYTSQKGQDLDKNPKASLLFYWSLFDRQIRISGEVERVSAEESNSYFKSRPLDSQISASISSQSHLVESREALEESFAAKKAQVDAGEAIETPITWGGYRLKPSHFEFWQGRENRLHDRLVYEKEADKWLITRLAP